MSDVAHADCDCDLCVAQRTGDFSAFAEPSEKNVAVMQALEAPPEKETYVIRNTAGRGRLANIAAMAAILGAGLPMGRSPGGQAAPVSAKTRAERRDDREAAHRGRAALLVPKAEAKRARKAEQRRRLSSDYHAPDKENG